MKKVVDYPYNITGIDDYIVLDPSDIEIITKSIELMRRVCKRLIRKDGNNVS